MESYRRGANATFVDADKSFDKLLRVDQALAPSSSAIYGNRIGCAFQLMHVGLVAQWNTCDMGFVERLIICVSCCLWRVYFIYVCNPPQSVSNCCHFSVKTSLLLLVLALFYCPQRFWR